MRNGRGVDRRDLARNQSRMWINRTAGFSHLIWTQKTGREERQRRGAQRTEDLPEQEAGRELLTEEACTHSPEEGEKHGQTRHTGRG